MNELVAIELSEVHSQANYKNEPTDPLSQNATIRRASVAERIGIRSDSNLRDEC